LAVVHYRVVAISRETDDSKTAESIIIFHGITDESELLFGIYDQLQCAK
jgi:hypothetical protein